MKNSFDFVKLEQFVIVFNKGRANFLPASMGAIHFLILLIGLMIDTSYPYTE